MSHPSPMHQNEGDKSYFNENGTENLNQEPDFDENIELINLSKEVNSIENDFNECSVPNNMNQFYFEDPKVKSKIKEAEKLIQKLNEARSRIRENIEERKFDRERILNQLKYNLSHRDSGFSQCLTWKRRDLNNLRQALDKKLGAKNQSKGLHSSVRVQDDLIRSLHCRLLHGSKNLAEEKQILREIKQLEGTRDMVTENAAEEMKGKGWINSLSNEEIQDRIELIIIDIGEMKKSQQEVKSEIEQAKREKAAIEKDIDSLHKELAKVYQRKREADTRIFELRKQNLMLNSINFYLGPKVPIHLQISQIEFH